MSAATTVRAPSFTNRLHRASPIPLAPPVTTTTFSFTYINFILFILFLLSLIENKINKNKEKIIKIKENLKYVIEGDAAALIDFADLLDRFNQHFPFVTPRDR
jgi:hypothetical protein